MKKKCKSFRFNSLAIALLLIAFSCDKDHQNESLVTQELFNAPSIESAQQFFNQNSGYLNTSGIQARNSSSSLLTDWENSKTKDYKETPEVDVDILYTPIYLQTDRNAKAFIASTQHDDTIESKIVLTLYKSTNGQDGLSAYIFIYNIDGTLELEYNIENGQPIPFPTNDGISNRTTTTDCSDLPGLSLGEFLIWISTCTIALDEVVVIGGGGSGSEGGSFNSDLPNFMQIPYIEGIGSGDIGGGSSSGTINGVVYASNVIAPTSFSISAALDISLSSIEAQWLLEQSITNPSLLDAIAEYLNSSKKIPDDPTFNIVNPNQLPDVSEAAINYILGMINLSIDNPSISIGIGNGINPYNIPEELHFDTSAELQAFFENLNSTDIISENAIDPDNPQNVIERCTFPDLLLNFNVYIEQTLGDDYNILDITSNVSGFTAFVTYEQLNWTIASINPNANLSNVIVNSEVELSLVYKGVGTLATYNMHFNIYLDMSDGTVFAGSMIVD